MKQIPEKLKTHEMQWHDGSTMNVYKDFEVAQKVDEIIDYLTPEELLNHVCGKLMSVGAVTGDTYCANPKPCWLHDNKSKPQLPEDWGKMKGYAGLDDFETMEVEKKDWEKEFRAKYSIHAEKLSKTFEFMIHDIKKLLVTELGDAIEMAKDGWMQQGRKGEQERIKKIIYDFVSTNCNKDTPAGYLASRLLEQLK